MIPDWQGALSQALHLLRPGGTLGVVDFGDRAGLPRVCDRLLTRWLSLFDVVPRPEILGHLRALEAAGVGRLDTKTIGGGYAFRVMFTKSADRVAPAGGIGITPPQPVRWESAPSSG
jgi:S-adenosylmethionine-diacylgycerolhomoserine-N-methlytransferase